MYGKKLCSEGHLVNHQMDFLTQKRYKTNNSKHFQFNLAPMNMVTAAKKLCFVILIFTTTAVPNDVVFCWHIKEESPRILNLLKIHMSHTFFGINFS